MTSPQVLELVERFDRNLDAYKSADYKEAHVRAEFIVPFFEALGWDVRNVQSYVELQGRGPRGRHQDKWQQPYAKLS